MFKLAWRNLWKNRRRTFLSLVLLVAGFSFLVLYYAFILGYLFMLEDNLTGTFAADIQVFHQEYNELRPMEHLIAPPQEWESRLQAFPQVQAVSGRLLLQGMVSTAYAWKNTSLIGVLPERERTVSTWDESMVSGRYPQPGERGWILLGWKLAERLKADTGDRVVVMTQARDGTIEARNFRVLGLVRIPKLDEFLTVVHREDLAELAHLEDAVSIYFLRTTLGAELTQVDSILTAALPADFEVLTWMERYPFFQQYWGIARIGGLIYLSILLFAAALGIFNILYMSVAERYREFGVMMAIGMRPATLRRMVLGESLILATVGLAIGGVFTAAVYTLWSRFGLDLSAFAQGMEFLGLTAKVFPALDLFGIVGSVLLLYLFSVLAGLYPAWRASRYRPVEALRIIR